MLELSFAIHWLAAYWKKSLIMRHGGGYTTMKDDEERVRFNIIISTERKVTLTHNN